jgi:hypothetical protein
MSSTDIPQGVATGEPRITQPDRGRFPLKRISKPVRTLPPTETKKDNPGSDEALLPKEVLSLRARFGHTLKSRGLGDLPVGQTGYFDEKGTHYAIKKTTNGFEMSEHLPVFGEVTEILLPPAKGSSEPRRKITLGSKSWIVTKLVLSGNHIGSLRYPATEIKSKQTTERGIKVFTPNISPKLSFNFAFHGRQSEPMFREVFQRLNPLKQQ